MSLTESYLSLTYSNSENYCPHVTRRLERDTRCTDSGPNSSHQKCITDFRMSFVFAEADESSPFSLNYTVALSWSGVGGKLMGT